MVEKKQKNWKRNFWHWKTRPSAGEQNFYVQNKRQRRRDIGTELGDLKTELDETITAVSEVELARVKRIQDRPYTVEATACKKNEQNIRLQRKNITSKWRVSTRKLQKL